MRKEDIKSGMVVKLRNGEIGLVLDYDNSLVIALNDCFLYLFDFDCNLEYDYQEMEYDIVYVGKTIPTNLLNIKEQYITVIWEREKIREVTIGEIEKELGYKIKIVK